MTRETRRAIVDALVTEIRLGAGETELVVRPELRRMVVAVAAPEVRVESTWARDAKARFSGEPRGRFCGPGWIRTSDPSDVNRVL